MSTGHGPPFSPWDWYPGPIPRNLSFGANCWVPTAYGFHRFRSRATCGVRVGPNTSLGAETSFDVGPDGQVVIGSTCNIVGAAFVTNGHILIGDHVLISVGVTLADHAWAVPPVPFTDEEYRARMPPGGPGITVGDDVWLGVGVSVVGGAAIGDGAIIGAATVVDGPVPPYAVFAGNPGRVVGWARPTDDRSVHTGVRE